MDYLDKISNAGPAQTGDYLDRISPAPKNKGLMDKAIDFVKQPFTEDHYAGDDTGLDVRNLNDLPQQVGGALVSGAMGVADGATLGLTRKLTDQARKDMPSVGLVPNPITDVAGQFAGTIAPWSAVSRGVQAATGLNNMTAAGRVATQTLTGGAVGGVAAQNTGHDAVNSSIAGSLFATAISGLMEMPDAVKWFKSLSVAERDAINVDLRNTAEAYAEQVAAGKLSEAQAARMNKDYFRSLWERSRGGNAAQETSSAPSAERKAIAYEQNIQEPIPQEQNIRQDLPESRSLSVVPEQSAASAPETIAISGPANTGLPAYTPAVNQGGMDYLDRFVTPQQSEVIPNGEGQGGQEGRREGLLTASTDSGGLNNPSGSLISPVKLLDEKPISSPTPGPEVQPNNVYTKPEGYERLTVSGKRGSSQAFTVNLTPSQRNSLREIRQEVSDGQAGGRAGIYNENAPGSTQVSWSSSFPEYFQNKGLTKAKVLPVLDRIIAGQPVTEAQWLMADDMLKQKRQQTVNQIIQKRRADFEARVSDYVNIEPSKINDALADIFGTIHDEDYDALASSIREALNEVESTKLAADIGEDQAPAPTGPEGSPEGGAGSYRSNPEVQATDAIDESGWGQQRAAGLEGSTRQVQFGEKPRAGRSVGLSEFMDGFTPDPQQGLFDQSPPSSDFGPVLTEYRHNAKDAIAKLMELRNGEAIGALYHHEIGDIDIVWGKEGTGKSDGYGLAKILQYHPEVADNLQNIISDMRVSLKSKNRINLESEKYKATVRLEWDGVSKTWLLTAFEKRLGGKATTDTFTITGENDTASPSTKPISENIISPSSENVKPSSGGGSHADTGGYNLNPPGAQNDVFGRQKVNALQLPEIVEIAKNLMNGQYPHIMRKLAKRGALGVFKPGRGSIELIAELAKTPGLLERVLAHEVGHLIDWLPDRDINRGNILGRIASLKKYMGNLLAEYEGAPEVTLNKKDRARLRREAEKELKANERPDETVIETITREVPVWKYTGIDPEMIKSIWNDTEGREKFPKLYRALSEMSDAEKKAVLVQAMKGLVHEKLKSFGERVQVGTETETIEVTRTIPGVKATPEAIAKRYAELVAEEIAKRNLYKREVISQELKDLTMHWKPFQPGRDPGYTAYRFSSVELYADALSALINDPVLLRKIAPTFEKAFFSYLNRKPDVRDIYYEIQQRLNDGEAINSTRRENIRGMFDRGEAAKKETERRPVHDFLKEIYRELIDTNVDLNWKVKEAKKNGYVPDAQNPQYWTEQLPYVSAEVYNHLSTIDSDILTPLKADGITIDDLGEYMMLKRITGDRAELANPLGHTPETARAGLDFLRRQMGDEKFKKLEAAIQQYRAVREENVLSLVEKSGMWSRDLLDHVRNNDDYATFDVQKFIEQRYGRQIGSQIYKQIGTLQEIRNPFIATVMKDAALIRAANIQMVKKVTTDFLQQHFPAEITPADTRWNGKGYEPVEPQDPKQGMIIFPVGGTLQAYYVPKGIAEIFDRNPYIGGVIARTLSAISMPLRNLLVSKNPVWMSANLLRDFIETWKVNPKLSMLDLIKSYQKAAPQAWADAMHDKHSPLIREMLKNKELVIDRQFTGIDEAPDNELDRMLQAFGKSPVQYRNKVIKPVMWVWDHLGKLGKFSERWGKLSGRMAIEGLETDPIRRAHMVRSRVGTPDVHRGGKLKPIYNNIFLFSNVNKEGWRSSWEAMKESPATYVWKTAFFNLLPKLIMKAAKLGLLGYATKQVMDKVGEYFNTMYTVVPLGTDSKGKSVVLTIPQDYSGQVIGGIFWKAINGELGGEKGLLSFASEQTPYGLNPWISLAADTVQMLRGQNPYDDYRGKQVVPESVWKAKDYRSIEALLKYEWNQMGGSTLYRFSGDGPEQVHSELEKILKLPGANVVGRFVRVTDQGEREKLKEITGEVGKQSARKSLDVKDSIIKDINNHDGKPTISDMVKLYRNLLQDKALDIDTKFSEFRPRYERYLSKVENNAKIDAVVNAQSQGEKAALLQHYQDTMSADEYRRIVQQLLKEGHIKRGAFREMALKKAGIK